MSNNQKSQYDYLIEFLENERNSVGPWIQRKEVAVWSAVVLYLTGFFIVTRILC
jgi:hypothetical protein